MASLKKGKFNPLCLVCGIDSGPIRWFLYIFMGALALTSLCTLAWALGTRRVNGGEKAGWGPIEAEN